MSAKGRCYSCQGYKRSLKSIKGAKACYKRIKAKRVAARYRGKAGCGKRKFRNGVLDQCYSCPRGYARGIALGKDLTKQPKACFRVTINPPKLKIKPPKGLVKRALKEIRPYSDLIVQAVLSLPRAQKSLLTGKDPKKYRDDKLMAAIKRFNAKNKRRADMVAPSSSHRRQATSRCRCSCNRRGCKFRPFGTSVSAWSATARHPT